MLYNLTAHNQAVLSKVDLSDLGINEVEVKPRLQPADNPKNYQELKEIVKSAVSGIRPGSMVLIGGLGQFQGLIMQLPFRFYFADFNFAEKRVEGVIPHQPFTRQELFDIENHPASCPVCGGQGGAIGSGLESDDPCHSGPYK